MLIYFILIILILFANKITRPKDSTDGRQKFTFISYGLLILVAALRREDVGYDLQLHYVSNFEIISHLKWSEIPEYSETGYEIGYCYFCKLMSFFSDDVQSLIIGTSIISLSSIGYFFYKKSPDILMSTLLFLFFCTFYMYMNIVRQIMALSFILIGICWAYGDKLKNNRIIRRLVLLAFILLASTFHSSAILCLIILLFDVSKFTNAHIYIGVLICIAIFFAYDMFFINIANLFETDHYEMYMDNENESKGSVYMSTIMAASLISASFILVFFTLGGNSKRNLIQDTCGYGKGIPIGVLLACCLMASICRILIFRMNIFNRFSFYYLPFCFIAYPIALEYLKNNRNIIKIIIYVSFFVYFFVMTLKHAKILYATIPYYFYWE